MNIKGYDMDFRKNQIKAKIVELKINLKNTDYTTNKLTEAIAEYIVYGNNAMVTDLYNQYLDVINQRKDWRAEIDTLESELKLYEGV